MKPWIIAGLVLGVAVFPLRAQPGPTPPDGYRFSAFLGAGWSNLTAGPGQGATFLPGPLGVRVEGSFGRTFSWRTEVLGQMAGTEIKDVGFLERDGRILRGQVGIAAIVRMYSGGSNSRRFFAAAGFSVATQVYCDLELGETIPCEETEDFQLRPVTTSSSAIGSVGLVRGRLAVEFRYDHGLRAVIVTPDGNMYARSFAAIGHYRFGRVGG